MEDGGWDYDATVAAVPGGREMQRPGPLYTKLEPEVVDQEVARLGAVAS